MHRTALRNAVAALLLALLCAASMYCWDAFVLNAARARGEVAGNGSDLYPRWYGARELLDRGRDPYSPEITREIQQGYYGAPLPPGSERDQSAFAYPLHVVFLLGPFRNLDFATVQCAANVLVYALVAATALLWVWMLADPQRRPSPLFVAAIAVFAAGSWPSVQSARLQQPEALIAFLIALATFSAIRGHPAITGVALAVATVKPQAAIAAIAWYLLWTLVAPRRRWPLTASFFATLAIFAAACEYLLPGWFFRWLRALREYSHYAPSETLPQLLAGDSLAPFVAVVILGFAAVILWRLRHESPAKGTAVAVAAAMLVLPHWISYRQLALVPAVIWLWSARERLVQSRAARVLAVVATVVIAWQWLTAAAVFVGRSAGITLPVHLPLYTITLIPIAVNAALALLVLREFSGSRASSDAFKPAPTAQ